MNIQITDHEGNVYATKKEMCRHWGIAYSVYSARIRRGMSLKETLTTPVNSNAISCRDHTGKEFSSLTKMCRHWGVNPTTYISRRKRGMSLKDTLTKSVIPNYIDHTGREFDTIAKMCKYWGVKSNTFAQRRKKGLSLEEALTVKINRGIRCKDHTGREFRSKVEMCSHWGIPYSTFNMRLKSGMSLEEALTYNCTKGGTQVQHNSRIAVVDHTGRKFATKKEMCEYWGINLGTYLCRRRRGMSLEDALTQKANPYPCVTCKDHTGREFNSITEMCKYWGIPLGIYSARVKSGFTVEDALTAEPRARLGVYKPRKEWTSDKFICKDHKGNEFISKKAMCKHYGVPYQTFNFRLRKGYPLEYCLTGNKVVESIFDNEIIASNSKADTDTSNENRVENMNKSK